MPGRLGNKHRRTLAAIFHSPTPGNLVWQDVENMLKALGAEISSGRQSRKRVALKNRRAVFHLIYSERNLSRGMVKSIRRFLIEAGVDPGQYPPNDD